MANNTISPIKSVKCLGVHLDKNLTFEAQVQSVHDKMAKQVSAAMQLRYFCESSKVVRYYITYNLHEVYHPIRSFSIRSHEEK